MAKLVGADGKDRQRTQVPLKCTNIKNESPEGLLLGRVVKC